MFQRKGKKTPYEKELELIKIKEAKYLEKRTQKNESALDKKLAEYVPDKLQGTLDAAFASAFKLVFEKGTKLIEKTYDRKELEKSYKINEFTQQVKQDKKSLRAFSKQAGKTGAVNTLVSGVSGIGLGLLGIGLPDIPLFTGMILKNIYEIALNYGYQYDSEGERYFILKLIQGALSYGGQAKVVEEELEQYMRTGRLPDDYQRDQQIKATAGVLSKELLYMKFLQGIPIVGVVGGAYDMICMKQIAEYANIKYRVRFMEKQNVRIGRSYKGEL